MQNSPARSGIDVGSVIADTYTIEAQIGRGGMGAVFLASHKRLPGKKVAIKMLHAEMSGEEVLARFRREAEIASRLGHPNIVQVHDFNMLPDGTPYLVLEYLHGESLAQRLAHGPMAIEPAMSIVRQVGSALAAAHREGIVHRDLKPQNIFLVSTEVDGRVIEIAKVLDFGISKIRGSTTVKTQDSALLGTPQYMAPEQATGQHSSVDERTDVFAFGAIVYEMLSGKPAFSGETIPEVVFKVVYEQPAALATHVAGVPKHVADAVHHAMEKAAADRFATVGAFVEALTGHALPSGRPTSIPPPMIGFAGGSRAPNTDKDAFAQTMGSGDHGESPVAQPSLQPPTTATVGAPSPNDLGTAGTVTASRTMPQARRRSRALIVMLAIVGAAAAAIAMYFVVRARAPKVAQPVESPPVIATAPAIDAAIAPALDAALAPAADAALAPVTGSAETSTGSAAPKPKPALKTEKPAKAPPTPTPTPTPKDDDNDGGDETAAQKLADARDALAQGAWSRAETSALAVTTSEHANARQRARANMIYGIVMCNKNDQESAATALRKIGPFKVFRKHLIDACHQAGYLLNQR